MLMEKFNSIEDLTLYGKTHSVLDVLCSCFKVKEYLQFLSLLCSDLSPILEAWAYDNDVEVMSIIDAIELNLGSVDRLYVEKYSDCDGWVECELTLNPDIKLRFSWELG